MSKHDKEKLRRDEQKQKIRARYKGMIESEPILFKDDKPEKRVAVYCCTAVADRFTTTTSSELMKLHYEQLIKEHENWTLTEFYIDEEVFGASLLHRKQCLRMIEDAKAGKFDFIITKSVSRLARNVLDCMQIVRELAALNPPVGIFFEAEYIYTLDNISEMMLAVLSVAAQEKTNAKSEIVNISPEQRWFRDMFLTMELPGYDFDEDGNFVINRDDTTITKSPNETEIEVDLDEGK